jgi:nitric oxide reductase large subunit
LQSAILTLIFGFAILGYAAVRTFRESAPVPARIVDETGRTLSDHEDIVQGPEHFLTYSLMQYGTAYGHTNRARPSRSEVWSIFAICQADIEDAPMWSALPARTMASSASRVSSIGVDGSKRWIW